MRPEEILKVVQIHASNTANDDDKSGQFYKDLETTFRQIHIHSRDEWFQW